MPSNLYMQAEITSYDDAVRFFSRAKSPAAGRPFKSWGRMFKEGNDFVIKIQSQPVLKITPDNKISFVIDGPTGRNYSNTLSSGIHRAVPLLWIRIGKGRYRVGHTKILDQITNKRREESKDKWANPWRVLYEEGQELYKDITFDLITGECVNPQRDLLKSVQPEMRTEWLRKLRKFKRNVKLRAKLGAIDGMIAQMNKENNNSPWHHVRSNRPNWQTDEWLDNIVTAMKDETCPPELMRAFIISSFPMWGNATPNGAEVVNTVEGILTEMSIDLRKKFGVFDQSIGEAA